MIEATHAVHGTFRPTEQSRHMAKQRTDTVGHKTDWANEPADSQSVKEAGALIVFEGPDGVGKTTLVGEVGRRLALRSSVPVTCLSFPGRDPGTLGRHIYDLHHDPARFDVRSITSTSLQLLHVAAHLEAIELRIRPRLAAGEIVLLDRYWWSTWVYGIVGGADPRVLNAMIELERTYWGSLKPFVVLLVGRTAATNSGQSQLINRQLTAEYAALAERESARGSVVSINNDGTLNLVADTIVDMLIKSPSSVADGRP